MPLPEGVTRALSEEALAMATPEGYRGYGSELGDTALRTAIAEKMYNGAIAPSEVTISDGSKCAIARLQALFGPHVRIGVQDPSYPVFCRGKLYSRCL